MPSILIAAILLFSGAGEGGPSSASAAPFAFQPRDHVCLLGNGLAERMQQDGWFETTLQERLPRHELSLRNLGFSGDELTIHPRVDGFGSWDDHLTRCGADVVIAFFGFNESFRGEPGLEPFRRDLQAFIDHTRAARYHGANAPRLLLVSPTPFEPSKSPLLPDARAGNERLRKYVDAMAEVARERGVPFVDAFTPMERAFAASSAPLTLDSVHLRPTGNRILAEILVSALGEAGERALDETRRQQLREAVLEKDRIWFNREQTTDGYNVYGGRSALAYAEGISNFTVLQRELVIQDAMAERRDRRIWALAQGRDAAIDDADLPPKIRVPTNFPGTRPDGSHEFLDAKSAIALMTPQKGTHVELFADEQRFPELAKPVQMSFDARGRLWVAAWPTYPHWEPGRPMNDKLLIFEDVDHDGRADVCKTFAGDLRNPTGFEFWNGGVFVAQAPDLLFLKDSDGDDVADVREHVLSNLSSADTHHTANSFVFGPDGALYFQEGTFHRTQIESVWGPERNRDACVWRFEPRTWRVERHVAYNFANPHGHVFDAWGQEFVTDGTGNDSYYALPFSTRVVHPDKHASYFTFFQQRSRPCAGTTILSSRHFPPESQGHLLLCNVIGFQGIFGYRFTDDGSGFGAEETEPLVFSSDPRFRPSDVEVGPDGAVWFLDWSTPIIGHMQHHLRDPNRDHDHGRVYRVVCDGRPLLDPPAIAGRPIPELLGLLQSPDERVRYRTRLELSARDSKEVVAAARAWASQFDPDDPLVEHHRLEALWLQEQHATLDEPLLDQLLKSSDARVRAAATHVLGLERRTAHDPIARLRTLASNPNARVRLEAVVAASQFDDAEAASIVFDALRQPTDKFLDYAIGETMRTLEPFWRPALAAGKLDVAGNPAAIEWLVARVSESELDALPRTVPVLEALITRHALSTGQRRAVADELAALRKSSRATELLRAMQVVDRRGGEHARHVQHALGAELMATIGQDAAGKAAAGAPDRAALRELADQGRLPETGAFARAACIELDGGIEKSWSEATATTQGLLSFLGALEHVDATAAEAAYSRVRSRVIRDESWPVTEAQPQHGWLTCYFPVRLRTAAREGFERLEPAAIRTLADVGIELPGIEKSDAFALRFQAELSIERAGDWSFHVASDDGSRLYVDGGLAVDNDRDHEMRERTATLALAAGVHALELCYFDQGGFEGLHLEWSGPGVPRQPIPVEALSATAGDPLRAAAIRALAAIPGHAEEKRADAVRLLQEGTQAAGALALFEAIPDEAWSAAASATAIDAIARLARTIATEERTRADLLALLALGERLAVRLPDADATARRRELRALRGSTVLIRTVPHQMLYDRREFTVAAGGPVAILFQNNDLMPHNLVVTAPGALETVGTAAEESALDPKAQARSFVPELPEVLFKIRLLLPGESATLRFVAPEKVGDYPFVCTFPGHWRVMNGVMHVAERGTEIPDAAEPAPLAAADDPSAAGAATRDFVRMWALADFQPTLVKGWERDRSAERGRAIFSQAGCVKCHWFRGDGVKSAPDLSEVAKKYRDAELLKQILDPSAVLLEGYENHVFLLKDGRDLIGRVVKEDERSYVVAPNLQEPDKVEIVAKEQLQSERKSKLSPMPTGLLVTFTRDEILDLLALLQSPPADPPASPPAPPKEAGGG